MIVQPIPVSAASLAAETAARIAGDIESVYPVTNAQRLAGTRGDGVTPLVAGDIVKVTNQGNRIEMYLGGADFTNPNWLVLDDTAEIIFNCENNFGPSSPADYNFNGVACPIGTTTNVGWVKVREGIPVGNVDGTFSPLYPMYLYAIASVGYTPAISSAYTSDSLLMLLSSDLGHTNPVSRAFLPLQTTPRATVTIGF